MKRREFLTYSALGAIAYTFADKSVLSDLVSSAHAARGRRSAFSEQWLQQYALNLAKKKYKAPRNDLPSNYKKLDYSTYRDIRFNPEKAIWKKDRLPFQMQLFHTGFLYKHNLDIYIVDQKQAKRLDYSTRYFNFGKLAPQPKPKNKGGFSGFRIHSQINNNKVFDEFCLFQGASYFRAVARDQAYGLSARGLAINTGQPSGEEFPNFTSFWIVRPTRNATDITVYALLDSPSVVGIYKFVISPGRNTMMKVSSTLYPRKKMSYVGIAPLTSMYMHGPGSRQRFDDFRPRVHDSEGLHILNGKGELIWRPLINPKGLQFSSFLDDNPKGFGLIQRNRDFDKYEDLEAQYEKRPSLWVHPDGDWGEGSVQLIEIPTQQEIHDNIVAFWKPKQTMMPGQMYTYNYTLSWCQGPDENREKAYIYQSRVGKSLADETRQFVVEYKLPTGTEFNLNKNLKADVSASAGKISDVVLQENSKIGGVRLSFQYDPNSTKYADLRSILLLNDKPVSEVWVYRWET